MELTTFEMVHVVGFIAAGIFAVIAMTIYVFGRTRQMAAVESDRLGDLRKERVEALEAKVADQGRELAELRGMFTALEQLKAEEIAEIVVRRLRSEGLVEA